MLTRVLDGAVFVALCVFSLSSLVPVPHVPPRLVGFVHPPTEVYYDGLNLGHKVCDGSGEDPTCADQWLLPLGVSDHVTYLGLDFVAEWLKCNL